MRLAVEMHPGRDTFGVIHAAGCGELVDGVPIGDASTVTEASERADDVTGWEVIRAWGEPYRVAPCASDGLWSESDPDPTAPGDVGVCGESGARPGDVGRFIPGPGVDGLIGGVAQVTSHPNRTGVRGLGSGSDRGSDRGPGGAQQSSKSTMPIIHTDPPEPSTMTPMPVHEDESRFPKVARPADAPEPKPKPEPKKRKMRTFECSDELWEAAKAKAHGQRIPLAEVLRHYLHEYVDG